MTAAELIIELQKLPPDTRMMARGYEGGYCDAGVPAPKKVRLNVHTEWYYGPHDDAEDYAGTGEVVDAAII